MSRTRKSCCFKTSTRCSTSSPLSSSSVRLPVYLTNCAISMCTTQNTWGILFSVLKPYFLFFLWQRSAQYIYIHILQIQMHQECFDSTTPQVEPVLPHSMGDKRWGASKEALKPIESKPSTSTSTSSCWRRRRSWSWTRSLAASSKWSRSLQVTDPTWKARLRWKGFRMTSASCSTGVHHVIISHTKILCRFLVDRDGHKKAAGR